MTDRTPAQARLRAEKFYGLGTAVALTVTVIFATAGDGVKIVEASGLRRVVVDGGHTLVWLLLTIAFAIATAKRRWGRVSNSTAITAGVVYAVFLFAVFVWR
ncbi:hypothetical protein [uncultured Aeromicrobium sp.]|uniref:hypothetical protein n=1 Tax=uncultured Aeromicrobium sp. TaxID=337820 RepID=UPI0025E282FA|nr:hypothetical protein [uncultured Aeromicrobium sp.]